MERYYTKDGTAYALRCANGWWDVYYVTPGEHCRVWKVRCEHHDLHLYEWAKHLHGNAPSGTPYGWFRTTQTGKRIIVTV